MRNLQHPGQADLFTAPVFESREAAPAIDVERFRLRMKTAMSEAIRASGRGREAIADSMALALGLPSFSRAQLDNYTSPAKTGHDITLVRFKAFVRATGRVELWDRAVSDDGLIVLQGDEARLAEIARLQQEQKALAHKLRTLRAVPVDIKRGR
ncbi:MAG: hypothetical protein K8H74_18040 [Notoacmeibacter sp.]|nr:hypothetical protein [Notoacmeibacter sp.]